MPSVRLLFSALELDRIDDAVIDRAMQTPELAHYRPWIEDLRKDKPYQLKDQRRAAVPRQSAERLCRLEPAVRPDHLGLRFTVGGGARHRADTEPPAGSRGREAQERGGRRWPDLGQERPWR